jgi:hypothetical protein
MEIVGTVAALIGLTKEVTAASDSLVRHFRNAPKELVQIHNQISLVLLQLAYITQFDKQDDLDTLLPTQDVQILVHAMQIAKNDILAVRKDLESYVKPKTGKPSVSTRLSWALFDRKSVEDALGQLQRVEGRLMLLLQLLNTYVNVTNAPLFS